MARTLAAAALLLSHWVARAADDPAAAAATPPPPAAARSFHDRAEAAASREDWGEVEVIARDWERAAPGDPMPSLVVAQASWNQRKHAAARDAARRSIGVGESPVALFYLGLALGQLGEPIEAERALARSVELAPKDANAIRGWAGALANLGRYAQAASALARARPLLPPDLRLDDQLEYWKLAASWKFPPAALEHHARAGWFLERERWAEAAGEYRAALKLAPAFADCHYHLGWALHQLGDETGAEKEYRAAIAGYGKPERMFAADARYNLAQTLVGRHRAREAVPLLREAIALRGERFWLLHALGGACRADGDSGCAREAWEKILGGHEQLPDGLLEDVRRSLAEVGGATEKREEPRLRTGAEVPAGASLRCDHGVVLAEQGRKDEARKAFEEALAEAPEFGFCRMNLALALLQTGDAPGAERELRRAMASKLVSTVDATEERRWRANARFFLAQLIAGRQGPPKETIALIREAAAVLGETPYMAFVLGASCDAAGDRGCAVDAMRRALAGREQLSEANIASAERLLALLGAAR